MEKHLQRCLGQHASSAAVSHPYLLCISLSTNPLQPALAFDLVHSRATLPSLKFPLDTFMVGGYSDKLVLSCRLYYAAVLDPVEDPSAPCVLICPCARSVPWGLRVQPLEAGLWGTGSQLPTAGVAGPFLRVWGM